MGIVYLNSESILYLYSIEKIKKMKSKVLMLVTSIFASSFFSFSQLSVMRFETVKTFATKEAHQGIAVDAKYFYTINSRGIGKYNKANGEFIAEWNDTTVR